MKHLTLYFTNLLSIAVFLFSISAMAAPMTRYVCKDSLGELTLSLDVMEMGHNTKGVLTAISETHTIQANIESNIITHVGSDYWGHDQGGSATVIFKTKHFDDYVFSINNDSTSLTCTNTKIEKETYLCIKYTCGSNGVKSSPIEVPMGYQCVDKKPYCKT